MHPMYLNEDCECICGSIRYDLSWADSLCYDIPERVRRPVRLSHVLTDLFKHGLAVSDGHGLYSVVFSIFDCGPDGFFFVAVI